MLDFRSIIFGAFFGIIASIIVFNFILYVIYGEFVFLVSFFGQMALAATVILTEGTIFGYLFSFPSESDSPVSFTLLALSQYLSYYFAIKFTRLVFNTKKISPRLDFFCSLFPYVNFGSCFAILFTYFVFHIGRSLHKMATPFIGMFLTILMLGTVFIQLRRGNRQAIPFLVGWIVLAIGVWTKIVEIYMSFSGVRTDNVFLRYGFFVGWFTQAVCWSIVLVQRIDRTNKVKEHQNRQMIQLDKMVSIGMITSLVSHEIKNPLSVIITNSEFLSEYFGYIKDRLDAHTGENVEIGRFKYAALCTRYTRALADVKKCCNRIDSTIEHLKQFYRQTNIGSMSEVDLNDVVREAVYLVSHKIRKVAAGSVTELGEGLPGVRGNFQLLEQVVVNLLLNACQALESGRRIQEGVGSISTGTSFDADTERIVLTVKDNGHGMDDEVIGRITEPFFTTKDEGSGLGLYISKEIVQSHGGEILFSSKPGEGTEVKVLLPAAVNLSVKESSSAKPMA